MDNMENIHTDMNEEYVISDDAGRLDVFIAGKKGDGIICR